MGYTGTTNYNFQKPDSTNAFSVGDLNNALDKVDETIKNATDLNFDLNLDEDLNLTLKVTTGDDREFSDSVSLGSISGTLIIQEAIPYATMTIVKTATSQQVYTGDITTEPISIGAGTFKITITQFGNSIEKDIQISGDTVLDLSDDFVTVTPTKYNEADSWQINNTTISSFTPVKTLKNKSITIRMNYGTWSDGSAMYNQKTSTPSANMTVAYSASLPKVINSSGTFTINKTATYEYVMTGGGGGGGGGYSRSDSNYLTEAGNGGDGGNIIAVRETINQGTSIPVTIGQGGDGGNTIIPTGASSGSQGGATIFNGHTANGGTGGSRGNDIGPNAGIGGDGGTVQYIKTNASNISHVSNVGTDGANGTKGNSGTGMYGTGGYGGYGFIYNNNSYGKGGRGGNGQGFDNGDVIYSTDGENGTNGAVIIRLVAS